MTKKESGLIVTFDEKDSNYETQKFEVERFFRFFIEIAKEDFIKDLDYKNYREREIAYCNISNFQNTLIEGLMDYYEECYKKYHSTRTFSK